MKTNRYKSFSNYEDLNQEGFEALVKAIKTFNPKKGNFFSWAHNYIGTKISRSANLHTTIRVPLKVAKENPPHKEAIMPIIIEEDMDPELKAEQTELVNEINKSYDVLPVEQQNIINLAYGLDGSKPMSINKICHTLNISRSNCIKLIDSALSTMKDNIKL